MPTDQQIAVAEKHTNDVLVALGQNQQQLAQQLLATLRDHYTQHILPHYDPTARALVQIYLADFGSEILGWASATADQGNIVKPAFVARARERAASLVASLRSLPHALTDIEAAKAPVAPEPSKKSAIDAKQVADTLAPKTDKVGQVAAWSPWLLRVAAIVLAASSAYVAGQAIPSPQAPASPPANAGASTAEHPSAWPVALAWSSRLLAVGALVTAVHLLLRGADSASRHRLDREREESRRAMAAVAAHLAEYPEAVKALAEAMRASTGQPEEATVPIPVELLKEIPKLVASLRGGGEK